VCDNDRKVAYLAMPCYGELTTGAAKGFFTASAGKLRVNMKAQESSLLSLNMNVLWCWALNAAHRGERVDYFAMQHADIEPEPGWLDVLVEELEAKKLDVLGVVAPIKDQQGVTSIAMARPDGDTWRVHGRLTMREVYRLPETFTSEDLGYPLLLNTGLWVAKWGDWCRRIHFTIHDRIVFNAEQETYFAEVESEDWFVSRLFHEEGLKVGCTRKVELGHRGPMAFGNHEPWGNEWFDSRSLKQSVLDERAAGDWFPHDVAGWLTEGEGRELARLAEGKVVLEVGAYCGRSTICLAQTAKSVGVIDTFDGRGTHLPGDTLRLFRRNLRRHNAASKVTVYQGESVKVLEGLPPVYDLVFIDGSHDRDSVAADIEAAANVLRPGGLLVFHDYHDEDPGVVEAVDELVATGAELVGRCESLAIVRPIAGNLVEMNHHV
jgi:precorrin-6B methylase 2